MGHGNIPMEIYSLPTCCAAVPRLRAKHSPRRFSQHRSAADVVEEYLYDWGSAYEFDPNDRSPKGTQINSNDGKELSPMIGRQQTSACLRKEQLS